MRRGAVYPPHIPHTTTRLSIPDALARIQSYLTQSETSSYLHPDALIEPGGIALRTSAGPQGGIVMHHLARIAKGLDGEVLALDADELMFTQGQQQTQQNATAAAAGNIDGTATAAAFPKRWKSNVGDDGMPIKSALKRPDADAVDPDTYARNQEIVEGEDGEREGAPNARQRDAPPEIVPRAALTDKDARKADKKARRKKEQRDKQEARKAQ